MNRANSNGDGMPTYPRRKLYQGKAVNVRYVAAGPRLALSLTRGQTNVPGD